MRPSTSALAIACAVATAGCGAPAGAGGADARRGRGAGAPGGIYLTTGGADAALGPEGYQLTVDNGGVELRAPAVAGLFFGTQTLRQLLPAAIEKTSAQPGPWPLAMGTIRDQPRF